MKHKSKIVLGTVGLATVFLLAGTVPPCLPVKQPVAPQIRPVCDLQRKVEAILFLKLQTDCEADIPAADESVSTTDDIAAEIQFAQIISDFEPTAGTTPQVSSTAPAQQEQQRNEVVLPPKESSPKMGETRMVDGKK